MKKNLFVAAILGMMLVLGTMVVGCADGTPALTRSVEEILPSNWKTRTYASWIAWSTNDFAVNSLTNAERQNLIEFLMASAESGELSDGGQRFWVEILSDEPIVTVSGQILGCNYMKIATMDNGNKQYLLSISITEALSKLNTHFGTSKTVSSDVGSQLTTLTLGLNWVILADEKEPSDSYRLVQCVDGEIKGAQW